MSNWRYRQFINQTVYNNLCSATNLVLGRRRKLGAVKRFPPSQPSIPHISGGFTEHLTNNDLRPINVNWEAFCVGEVVVSTSVLACYNFLNTQHRATVNKDTCIS